MAAGRATLEQPSITASAAIYGNRILAPREVASTQTADGRLLRVVEVDIIDPLTLRVTCGPHRRGVGATLAEATASAFAKARSALDEAEYPVATTTHYAMTWQRKTEEFLYEAVWRIWKWIAVGSLGDGHGGE